MRSERLRLAPPPLQQQRRLQLLLLLLLATTTTLVAAHMRWVCPEPRDNTVDGKNGPCGGVAVGTRRQWFKGGETHTLTFVETITHAGAPFRIALSVESSERVNEAFEDTVLLDHIPHDDASEAGVLHSVDVRLPNIACPFCTLQIVNFMTDKLDANVTNNCTYDADCTTCALPSCFSNYHSCADIVIDGVGDPELWASTYTYARPASWPFPDATRFPTVEQHQYFRGEWGNWSASATATSNFFVDGQSDALVGGCVDKNFSETIVPVEPTPTTPYIERPHIIAMIVYMCIIVLAIAAIWYFNYRNNSGPKGY